MGKHAKVLGPADVRRLLRHVLKRPQRSRDTVIILLSFKAGLRAAEIAGLDWHMVLSPSGRLADHVAVCSSIAKNGSGRRVPLNPELKAALTTLHKASGRPRRGAVIQSQRGSNLRPRSVVNWFHALYAQVGLEGCSSHSGRRTFITRSARALAKSGGSLRDVQLLVGHKSIETTQTYIEGDREAQWRLVRMI